MFVWKKVFFWKIYLLQTECKLTSFVCSFFSLQYLKNVAILSSGLHIFLSETHYGFLWYIMCLFSSGCFYYFSLYHWFSATWLLYFLVWCLFYLVGMLKFLGSVSLSFQIWKIYHYFFKLFFWYHLHLTFPWDSNYMLRMLDIVPQLTYTHLSSAFFLFHLDGTYCSSSLVFSFVVSNILVILPHVFFVSETVFHPLEVQFGSSFTSSIFLIIMSIFL